MIFWERKDILHRILLVDNLKSSLVMTSEIFKDCIKGCHISIVRSGKDCIRSLKGSSPDMIVVDFDLPDTDGVMLSRYLKKSYRGPVVITAFPDRIVDEAISRELYVYNDSCRWVKKPVRMKEFESVIEDFLTHNRRVTKRFHTDWPVLLKTDDGSRKKKSQTEARIVDISMGGMKIYFSQEHSFQPNQNIKLLFTMYRREHQDNNLGVTVELKGEIKWTEEKDRTMGVCFHKVTDDEYDLLIENMRDLKPLDDIEMVPAA